MENNIENGKIENEHNSMFPRSKTYSTPLYSNGSSKKKKSKISLKLSQLETRGNPKEYEDLMKEDRELYGEDEENNIDLENIDNLKPKKFEIKLHYYILIGEETFNFETILILESNQKVEDIIIWGINSFNNAKHKITIQDKEYILRYNNNSVNDFKSYEIRNCKKKNFKPKFDMPPFLNNTSVENVVNERICLVCNNKSLLIMTRVLNEGDSDERVANKSSFCSKCSIY